MTVDEFEKLLTGASPAPKQKIQKEIRNFGDPECKTFCFTGTLSKTRQEMEDHVMDVGGDIRDRVTKTLDFLVAANPRGHGAKLKAARAYGVQIISEDEFWKMTE